MNRNGIRDRIAERRPFGEHEGASGAQLQRAVLDDGAAIILKVFDPEQDLTMRRVGRTVPLEVDLWQAGVLDRLPPMLGHAVIGAWPEGGTWVVAMSDLGDSLLTYHSRISRGQCRRIIAAADGMHRAFSGATVPGLWTLEERLTTFAPDVIAEFRAVDNPLPDWVLQGWQRFDSVVPSEVADAVHGIHAHPSNLAGRLIEAGGSTLLHGDYWLTNIGLSTEGVVAIDWALATAGPPVVEFVSFLVGCANQVDATKEEILDDLLAVWGERHDKRLLSLGLICGLVELGWNLAWHVTEHPDESNRAELDWWIDAARRSLATE